MTRVHLAWLCSYFALDSESEILQSLTPNTDIRIQSRIILPKEAELPLMLQPLLVHTVGNEMMKEYLSPVAISELHLPLCSIVPGNGSTY
jgi:hypothetical protein